eukprot:7385354-Prymnesium_polylepis.1
MRVNFSLITARRRSPTPSHRGLASLAHQTPIFLQVHGFDTLYRSTTPLANRAYSMRLRRADGDAALRRHTGLASLAHQTPNFLQVHGFDTLYRSTTLVRSASNRLARSPTTFGPR